MADNLNPFDRSPEHRAHRILYKLDYRLERQTSLPKADRVTCTELVELFNRSAGFTERRVIPFAAELPIGQLAHRFRLLLAVLRLHRATVIYQQHLARPNAGSWAILDCQRAGDQVKRARQALEHLQAVHHG